MLAYVIRRLLLIIPTLLGIMIINFAIVQFAPGGPVEQAIARMRGQAVEATARFSGGSGELGMQTRSQAGSGATSKYRGAQGIDPAIIKEIERRFGFDKPPVERFILMMGNYMKFDFGQSFTYGRSVVEVVVEKLPVSISLGLWTTLITYFVSIPLGIAKAVRDGSRFDIWTSTVVIVASAIPSFLFAILLIVLFSGGSYLQWFPLKGLVSDNWQSMPWPDKIVDYFWHLALPLTAFVIGTFAGLTMLTKNSFLDQIHQQYVVTARAKGLPERRVLYGHVFRNAMLIVIAGFPGLFASILFSGSVLIETIFSLDGIGLLGFESTVNRDYPIMFGTLYALTLLALVLKLIGDFMYTVVDPRIDFEGRAV